MGRQEPIKGLLVSIDSWTYYFSRVEKDRKITFQEWIKQELDSLSETLSPEIKKENITLDKVSAQKFSFSLSYYPEGKELKELVVVIYAQNGERMYEINAVMNSENQNTYFPVFNQMLSTFRFLE